jgi:hypothetical protein
MADDCGTSFRGVVVYHHHRFVPHQVRSVGPVRVVGYEGSPRYLGRWEKAIRRECKRRGWRFETSGTPQDFDITVALRDDHVNGYAQRNWKSNVKLANAHACGSAFIGGAECGYLETQVGGELFVDEPSELEMCFDILTPVEKRVALRDRFMQSAYSVEQAAIDMERAVYSLV